MCIRDRGVFGEGVVFKGDSEAGITNLGRIKIHSGDLFLLARQVENYGVLSSGEGVVGVIGTSELLLKEEVNDRVYIRPNSERSILNEGTIKDIEDVLKGAGGNAYSLPLNQKGLVHAQGVHPSI